MELTQNNTLEKMYIPAFGIKRIFLGICLAVYTVIHFKFINIPYVPVITFIALVPCFTKFTNCPKCKQNISISPISVNAKCNKCHSVFLVNWDGSKKENLFIEVLFPTFGICSVLVILFLLWNFISG